MKKFAILSILFALYSCAAPSTESPPEGVVVQSYAAVDLNKHLYSVPEGAELVFSRVKILDPQTKSVLQESEAGILDNHIYQRSARPYTYLDANEPYIYDTRLVQDVLPTGQEIEIYQITREPNSSPVMRNDQIDRELPRVSPDVRRQTYISESDGQERVRIEFLVKGVTPWNRPLRARHDASPSEKVMVMESQVEYDRNRAIEIETITAPVIDDLKSLGSTGISVRGNNGWMTADIPVDSLEILSNDSRLSVIGPATTEANDNECIVSIPTTPPTPCIFTGNSSTISEADEWFLGDGARTERMDAQQFYDLGLDGSFNQGPHESLVAGIMEMGRYEDEAFFDKDVFGVSRMIKYNCEN